MLFNLNFWKEKLYTFIFASGVKVSFNGNDVIPMGMLWFFFVLFTGRIIFDYLHLVFEENQLFIVCCIISFIGIMLGKIQWLPFSLDITLAVIPFFYIGYKLKKYKVTVKPFRKMILWAQVFIMTLAITFPDYKDWTYMELAMRRYTLFPICYITSVAGTLFVCEISVLLYMYLKKIIKPICYLGRNSLYIFFIHYYDFLWRKIWTIEGHQFYSAFIRVVIDICVFLCAAILVNLVKKLTRITKIYFIQKSKFHVIQDKY